MACYPNRSTEVFIRAMLEYAWGKSPGSSPPLLSMSSNRRPRPKHEMGLLAQYARLVTSAPEGAILNDALAWQSHNQYDFAK